MPRLIVRALLLSLSLAAFNPARAEAPATPAISTAPVAAVPPLSLEDCVARALEKNFAVRIQNFAVSFARDQVIITKAGYDPTFGVTWQKAVVESPVELSSISTTLGGANPQTNDQSTTLSLIQPVITGGTVTASYGLSRDYSNTVQTLLNPAYDGAVSLNITQPLLQGAGIDYNRATIEIAQLGEKIANLNLKSSVLTTIYNVETAYSNLIYTRKQYVVGQDSLKLAQQLLDENTSKRNTGVLTDLDVVQAQAGVATAQSALIGFKQAMDNAEDTLLQALGEREFKDPIGQVEFPALPTVNPSFAYSYKLARDNGPNLAVVQATIEQYKLDALRAKRSNLPQLNAVAGAGYTSAEHTYQDANSSVWSGPGYNWNVGLTLSIPIGMRATRAQYRQALANLQSEQTTYDQTDQTLMVQVRAAVRAVLSNQEGVAAATLTTTLTQKQYELQKAKFDAGLATSYDVLQAQNALETARVTQLQAEVNLRNALANLRFLEGTSLDVYHVRLAGK